MIPAKRAHLHVVALSHQGMREGKNNEDRYAISSYFISEEDLTPVLFAIVSDGIGGHRAGEVAAEMVVDYVSQAVSDSDASKPLDTIRDAIAAANQAVYSKAQEDEGKHGMGATCACAWVIKDKLYTAAIGDSRIYLIRGATIRQISTDHTWIQEAIEKGVITLEQARDHPNVHVIRRYIGSKDTPEVDFRLRLQPDEKDSRAESNQGMRLQPGDSLLLCSDGLTDLVWNDEILEIARAAKDQKVAVQTLIDLANERGGHDNITIALLSVPKGGPIKTTPIKNLLWWIIGGVTAFLFTASALIGLIWYLVQPTSNPTPTSTPPPTLVLDTRIPPTTTLAPTLTFTPRPTAGPTYTPWPTNTP